MKIKRIFKFIDRIDYTIGLEKKQVPLSDYDEGFKAACNLIIGGIRGMNMSVQMAQKDKVFFDD